MGITLPIHQGLSDFTKSFSSHHVSLHLTKDSLRSSRGPADTLCARGACPLGALLIGRAVTAYMGEAFPAEGRAEQAQDAGKPRPISGSYSGWQTGRLLGSSKKLCWGGDGGERKGRQEQPKHGSLQRSLGKAQHSQEHSKQRLSPGAKVSGWGKGRKNRPEIRCKMLNR